MKKVKGLQIAIKYLLLAIILGGISGNLLCILECLSAEPFVPDFGVLVLLMSSILTYFIYFLFIREKKTVYALVCIPSTWFVLVITIDFWGRVFHLSSKDDMKFVSLGTVMFFYAVLYLCIIMVLATLLIRWILIKCEKVLDFKKTEEGYYVELSGLVFICSDKDKNYKKVMRTLADAYYREKEKEIITYMIHQEAFIRVHGEMTENEMLEKIEDMPFFPEISLQAEMCGTIAFYDETYVIELSFEGIFENLCDIKVRNQLKCE